MILTARRSRSASSAALRVRRANRQIITPPDRDSTRLSKPKPTRAMVPARKPASRASRHSTTL